MGHYLNASAIQDLSLGERPLQQYLSVSANHTNSDVASELMASPWQIALAAEVCI